MLKRLGIAALYSAVMLAVAPAWAGRVQPALEDRMRAAFPGEKLRVIVELKEQTKPADLAVSAPKSARRARLKAVVAGLKNRAARSQVGLRAELAQQKALGAAERVIPFWIFNGFAVTASEPLIRRLAARDDVLEVRLDALIPPPPRPAAAGAASANSEWNIQLIRAPEVWSLGYNGQGAVIGSFDTGVDLTHSDLFSRYRGDHQISWFDPYGEHSFPTDFHGHGTHTTGTALGGDAGGSQIGVAPGAKWIAAKAWADNGVGLTSAFHQIFEWFLAPGGDPENAPDVVNNSWAAVAAGCNTEFAADIQAWRAAEIFPAFAAGNAGPTSGSVRSPGAYPDVFAVGATDTLDEVVSFSSRGPSPCGGIDKPDISAPGSGIRSALPGGYGTLSGTSMATPHVAGAVAVLRSINPALTVEELATALTLGATDVAEPGMDNNSGAGRLDLAVAAEIAMQGPDAPVIKVVGTSAIAYELGGAPGVITFSRTGNTDTALEVKYRLSGTATASSDYVQLPGIVTIPAGSNSAAVVITPIDDAVAESNEIVFVTLTPDPAYVVSWSRVAAVVIISDDLFPDLIVTALSAPTGASAGQSITVGETTKNQGAGPTEASVTQYFLSSNSTLDDASDIALGSRNVPALGAGASSAGSTLVTLPADTVAGTWYLIARADSAGTVSETSEVNNTSARSIQIGPDLAISAFSAPSSAAAGQSVTLTETTKNQGAGSAAASATRYFLSTNTTLQPTDELLGSRDVAALAVGASSAGSTVVTIPAGTVAGTWYLIAKADGENVVPELSEVNNTSARSIQIGPDLVISVFSAPPSTGAGQSLTVSDTTGNQGAAPADASVTQYYLSSNTVLDAADLLLGSRDIAALAVGASSAGSTVVTIPAGTVAGTWYLIAKADGENAVAEVSESNNTKAPAIQIGPDLVVSVFSAPPSAGAGQSLTVTDTTKNQGAAPAEASVTQYFLSSNTTLQPTDVLIGSRDVAALAVGASSAGSTVVTIPAGTASGTWYLIAKADGENAVSETSESNNTKAPAIQIGPDLVISAISAPPSTGAGQSVTLTETTKNQGAAAADASVTQYYLSSNAVLDATDTLLDSRAVAALGAGASSAGSTVVTIPAGTASGAWYLIAKADSEGAIPEASESNNTSARSIQIGPDLVISALSAPSSASAGQSLTLTETTRNQGAASAGASVTQYYLSSNAVLDAADIPLASRAVAALGAGASSAGSTVVTIPAGTVAGAWYLIAKADGEGAVPETSESNNTTARSIQVGPDLIVSAFAAPASANAGQSLTLTETTRNQGAAPADASVTQYYLSSNAVLDAADIPLGTRAIAALGTGASNAGSTVVTIPAGTAAGTWYLIAKADGEGTVPETSESNNTSARSIAIAAGGQ